MMITISQALEMRLARVARRSGRSVADIVYDAILQYVEDSEDVFEAEPILRRVQAGRERTYTLEQVARRLNLES
jgi:RHH-type rel operon transcriptional repressor/antitoxin RelB